MSRLESLCSTPTSFVGIQVAEQQGKYLARSFNALAKDANAHIEPFNYRHMGSMASIGTLHMHEISCIFLVQHMCQAKSRYMPAALHS